MQLGFSVVGVAFLLALFVPNVRWAKNQPAGYEELQGHESRTLLAFERVGQVLTTCTSVTFVCPWGISFPWVLVLAAASFLMVLYEIAWARYFRGGERLDGMYRPLGPVSVLIIGIHLGYLHELSRRQP
ncbi:MAG: hypothetical protein ACI360_06330 [Atopobiaceae bacterium]